MRFASFLVVTQKEVLCLKWLSTSPFRRLSSSDTFFHYCNSGKARFAQVRSSNGRVLRWKIDLSWVYACDDLAVSKRRIRASRRSSCEPLINIISELLLQLLCSAIRKHLRKLFVQKLTKHSCMFLGILMEIASSTWCVDQTAVFCKYMCVMCDSCLNSKKIREFVRVSSLGREFNVTSILFAAPPRAAPLMRHRCT